jgi:hypothetical protein
MAEITAAESLNESVAVRGSIWIRSSEQLLSGEMDLV